MHMSNRILQSNEITIDVFEYSIQKILRYNDKRKLTEKSLIS